MQAGGWAYAWWVFDVVALSEYNLSLCLWFMHNNFNENCGNVWMKDARKWINLAQWSVTQVMPGAHDARSSGKRMTWSGALAYITYFSTQACSSDMPYAMPTMPKIGAWW
jgi:hypothetical protein